MIEKLTLISEFKNNEIFTLGNNEWATYGHKGGTDFEKFIEKSNEAKFYRDSSSPVSKKNLNEIRVLETIDSQWYLEEWHKYINVDSKLLNRVYWSQIGVKTLQFHCSTLVMRKNLYIRMYEFKYYKRLTYC